MNVSGGSFMNKVKAMILCAGRGNRLRPLTDHIPKPMLKVCGHPIFWYIIRHFLHCGIQSNNIVINLHYLNEKFQFPKEEICLLYEKELCGTAGSVLSMKEFLNSDVFIVSHGDTICLEDLRKIVKKHRERNAIATVLTYWGASNSLLYIDNDYHITKFIERPIRKTCGLVNSGVYCFSQEIFNYIPKERFSDFPCDVFQKLPAERFFSYPILDYRIAIDTHEQLDQAKRELEWMKENGINKYLFSSCQDERNLLKLSKRERP